MGALRAWITQNLPWLKAPAITFGITDVLEIIILSFVVYSVLVWIKRSRAWTLLKGMLFVGFFIMLTYLFKMDTLTFIISKGLNLVIIAAVIIFQPELRRALERLGEKEIFSSILPNGSMKEIVQRCSDRTVNEIVRATLEMAKVKTGALMVLEENETLAEYERTGITIDAIVSSQLLINVFEHNTPLHDGAVIIRGDKIVSATCYLPLSENQMLSKELGTRHRAGVGISEVTDSLTIIVSEETGGISIAKKGKLTRNVDESILRAQLEALQNKSVSSRKLLGGRKIFSRWKSEDKNEKGKEQNEA
ncbi:MAG: diadenylate cyclase CdaA [Eubacteriales bacterium]|nr:diadenylate cyclase CdaA [Eubacteriales bacterium]